MRQHKNSPKFHSILLALFSLFLSLSFQNYALGQCSIKSSATSQTLSLSTTGSTAYSVAYNPQLNLYYVLDGNRIRTYNSSGSQLTNAFFSNLVAIWWNPNTNQLEGKQWGTSGAIQSFSLNSSGYPTSSSNIVTGVTTSPSSSYTPAYNYNQNEIFYYFSGQIYRYSRATGAFLSSHSVTGLPTGLLTNNTVVYTGCSGNEIGLYDRTNKRVLFINNSTFAFSGSSQLPSTASTPFSYGISYNNDRFWLSTGSIWNAYDVLNFGLQTSNITGPFCDGSTVSVNFSLNSTTYNSGNVFTAQLSDASGSFNNPVTLGSVTSTTAQTITGTIPTGTAYGAGYRIRVVSSNPIRTGSDNGTNININVPDVNLGVDFSQCPGDTTILTAPIGALSYTWSTGATTQSIDVTTAGTYRVTVSNGVCSNADTIIASLLAAPTPTLADTVSTCNTTSVLNPGSFSSYIWNTGATSSTISPTNSGTYAVTVTASNTCEATDQTYLNLVDPQILEGLDTSICAGDSIVLSAGGCYFEVSGVSTTGSSVINTSSFGDDRGGIAVTPNYVYRVSDSWTIRVPVSLGGTINTYTRRDGLFSDLETGQLYSIWNTSINDFQSSTSTINALQVFNESMQTVGSPILLSQTITKSSYSLMLPGNGFLMLYTGNVLYKINLSTGFVTNLGAQPTLVSSYFGSENWASWGFTECVNGSYNLVYRAQGTNANSIVRYSLLTGLITPVFTSFALGDMASLTYSSWNNYLYYTAEGTGPATTGWASEGVGRLSATHNGSGGGSTINSYSWSTGATTPTIQVSPSSTTNYSVTVSHLSATCSDTIQITVNSLPSISLADTVLTCNTDSTQLDAGSGFTTYSWSTGVNTQTTHANNSGNYFVTVENSDGCKASDSMLVELLDARISPGDTTICSADSILIGAGSCGVEINSLSLSNATGADLRFVGSTSANFDDNCGIATTPTHIIVSGDFSTVKYSNDLSSGESYNFSRQGIFSDLNTGELYSFWNTSYTEFSNNSALLSNINSIRKVNPNNLGYGQTIMLSQSINASTSSQRIVAAGGGYVLLYAFPTMYKISLPDGQVEVLGTYSINMFFGEGWASYGVAECNNDNYNIVYRSNLTLNGILRPITRYNLASNTYTFVEGNTTGFGDAANLTVSPWAGKWYFNTESFISQFGAIYSENLVSFDASISNAFSSNSNNSNILWSTADTTSAIFINPSMNTSYSVTVTSSLQSCTDTIDVSVNASPIVLDSSNSLSCFGDTTGYASVSVSGGLSPYSYDWSSGDTVATLSNLSGGTYIYTVTGDNGCFISDTLTVTEPIELISTATILRENDCQNGTNGMAEISVTGGTGVYTFAWPTGTNDTIDSTLATGQNIVTITDANSCSIFDTITIGSIAQLTSPGPITSTGTFVCPGGSTTLFAANSDSGLVEYRELSDTVRTTISSSLQVQFTNLPQYSSGTPKLVMHYKGDLDWWSEYLNINSELNTYVGRNFTTTSCFVWATDTIDLIPSQLTSWLSDGQVTFTVSPTGSVWGCTYDYEVALELIYNSDIPKTYWFSSITTDTTLNIGTGSSANVTANATTTTFYAATFGGGCVSEWDSITILVPPKPNSNYTITPSSLCSGDSASVNATGAVSYAWPTDPTITGSGNSAVATPTVTTDYLISVTDFFGCVHEDTLTINVNPQPAANLLAVTPVSCQSNNDGTAAVFGTGGASPYSYSWPNGSNSAVQFALGQGAYIVTVTDANLCTDTITVNVDGPTPIDFGAVVSDISCSGQSDGSISISPSGGNMPYTISWSNGSSSNSLSSLSAGQYTITITDASNCSNDTTFSIIEPLPIVASITNTSDESCPGASNGSITAVASGGTMPFSYAWSNGGSGMLLAGISGGTYTVTITDAGGCTAIASGSVATQPSSIVVAFNGVTDVLCNGGMNGAATAIASGGNTPYTYAWSGGQSTAMLSGVVAGTYTVVATDAVGCQATNTVNINEPTAINSSISGVSNASCANASDGQATLNVSGGIAPYTYLWDDGSTNASNTTLLAGTNSVIVTDANGCMDTSMVTITEPAPLSLNPTVQAISCNGQSDGSISVSTSGGTNPYGYSWSNGQTTSSISNLSGGTYTLTVTDDNGCINDTSFTLMEPAPLTADITDSSNITCFGNTDGWAVVQGIGGSLPYTYNWSNGTIDDTLSGVTL